MEVSMLLVTLLSFLATVNGARILGIFPVAGKSHFYYNEGIMKTLHAAGHQVTVISPFPSTSMKENYTSIDSNFDSMIYVSQSTLDEFSDLSITEMMQFLVSMEEKHCYDIIKLDIIQDILKSKEKKFDVIFVQILSMFECFLPLAEKLGIPVIGTVTVRSWPLSDILLGIPNNPAVIPSEPFGIPRSMNFIQRFRNVYYRLYLQYTYYAKIRPIISKFYKQHFDRSWQYKKEVSLLFYNNHPCLLSRPLIANVIETGGIHIQPPKALPENMQKFIDGAKHGVILFTLGSVVRASTMNETMKQAFVNAFAHIPQRVIWKFEEDIPNISANVMLLDWVPQRDILEHENVIAFISHCGQSGTYEAIHTSTPVVTMPLFSDQMSNANILQELGVGVPLNYAAITTDSVLQALSKITNNSRYYEKMQHLSRVFKDRPMTPQQSVVFWTEYVIRNNGTSHIKAVGSNVSLFQYLILDIILMVLIIISLSVYVIYFILKKSIVIYEIIKKKMSEKPKES